jgi:hypothetical protein
MRLVSAACAVATLAAGLAACSNPSLYLDRRELVSMSGGDAIAANQITQMVDPWPPESGNRNIGFNGQKMQIAVERYRTDRVIPPIGATTSEIQMPPSAGITLNQLPSSSSSTASGSSGSSGASAAAAVAGQ